jgi:hypothetical protein
MPKPHIIVRPKRVRERHIPLGHTEFDAAIESGLLEVVPLTLKGRAKGITLRSIIRYQRDVMGLEPLTDDEPQNAHVVERNHPNQNT